MNIILIGFKGSGKSSVGKLLASKLGKNFIDTDQLIQEQHYLDSEKELKISDIYRALGEAKFRNLEEEAIAKLSPIKNSIIATGGGAVLNQNNIDCLKKIGTLIYLELSFDACYSRIKQEALPAYVDSEEELTSLYEERTKIYQHTADSTFQTEHKSIESIVNEIIGAHHGD